MPYVIDNFFYAFKLPKNSGTSICISQFLQHPTSWYSVSSLCWCLSIWLWHGISGKWHHSRQSLYCLVACLVDHVFAAGYTTLSKSFILVYHFLTLVLLKYIGYYFPVIVMNSLSRFSDWMENLTAICAWWVLLSDAVYIVYSIKYTFNSYCENNLYIFLYLYWT